MTFGQRKIDMDNWSLGQGQIVVITTNSPPNKDSIFYNLNSAPFSAVTITLWDYFFKAMKKRATFSCKQRHSGDKNQHKMRHLVQWGEHYMYSLVYIIELFITAITSFKWTRTSEANPREGHLVTWVKLTTENRILQRIKIVLLLFICVFHEVIKFFSSFLELLYSLVKEGCNHRQK